MMKRSRVGLRLLGLSSLLLCLFTVDSNIAQAEVGANWKVNGANITSSLLPTMQVGEIENKTASFLTKIAGATVQFLCTGVESIGAKLELEGKVSAGFKLKFTGCVTLLNGTLSPVCVPKTSGQPAGTVLTNSLKGLLLLQEGAGVVRIEPSEGETFKTYEFNVAGGCSLPEKVPVKGRIVGKDCKNEVKSELVSHLIESSSTTHLFVISDTAEHAVAMDGSATLVLGGAHAGLKWSGVPA